jgi:hypothetical protein
MEQANAGKSHARLSTGFRHDVAELPQCNCRSCGATGGSGTPLSGRAASHATSLDSPERPR